MQKRIWAFRKPLILKLLLLEEKISEFYLARMPHFCQTTSDMKRITIRMPDRLITALETQAAEEHRDLSNVIRYLLSQAVGLPYTEELDEKSNPRLSLK